MIVRDVRSTFSATSLGVFCRSLPSTRAIMRSTKVCPAGAVIRTTMRSESTVVPPVTAERSPPDSRMTGADSPVIADSSTLAMPSITSPSPGTVSPAATITTSPTASDEDDTSAVGRSPRPLVCSRASWGAVTLRAVVCFCEARRLAAWALPRLSATDSARVANRTVAHSHAVIEIANTVGSMIESTVQPIAPTSTTNMTGEPYSSRGSSLRSAAGSAAAS